MPTEYRSFRSFDDPALLGNLVDLLKINNIAFLIMEHPSVLVPGMSNTGTGLTYEVKIKEPDFNRVNQLLRKAEDVAVTDVSGDHYLLSFNDMELMEVLTKADEWSAFDYTLAKKILIERGVKIDEEEEEKLRLQRLKELGNKEHASQSTIGWGYGTAVIVPLIGLGIGYHLAYSKKTLPDGAQMYTYDNKDRWHGRNMIFIAAVIGAIAIACRIWVFNDQR